MIRSSSSSSFVAAAVKSVAAAVSLAAMVLTGCSTGTTDFSGGTLTSNGKHRTIIFVWDGLRPDSIDATNTPTLYQMSKQGVYFTDNHSTYPTYTMANGASFATGGFIGTTGFNGNNTYAGPSTKPGGAVITSATGLTSAGVPAPFQDQIFTEDWGILDDLNAYYQANYNQNLLAVGTLFQAAQAAGLHTAAAGKSGPAYLQDYKRGGIIVDENAAFPQSYAQELINNGVNIPANTKFAYPALVIPSTNGSPTAAGSKVTLADGVTTDPTNAGGGRFITPNQNLANIFTAQILANHLPDLSLFWLRNPDATEHDYGPGSPNYALALQAQDAVLAQIMATLRQIKQYDTTNIIVVSDHAHSTVSGPTALFPLRGLAASATAGVNTIGSVSPNGYSVSGYVRGADLLTRIGFHAYDGNPCVNEPVLAGTLANGNPVYPQLTDVTGSVCGGAAGAKYTTPAYKVPSTGLPSDAVIVVTPGGSEMYFVPSHNPVIIQKLVTFLQSREEYGPVFVDAQYGNIPGTFNASAAKLQNASARNPDIIASMNYDETVTVTGRIGITYNNSANNRGMHGSFSPIDVHNSLVAIGPDFKQGFTDTLPTGNVDIAPTVAAILGLSLPSADGRPLLEATTLSGAPAATSYSVTPGTLSTSSVSGLQFQSPVDPSGATIDPLLTGIYTSTMHTKVLTDPSSKTYTYFDYVKTIRQ